MSEARQIETGRPESIAFGRQIGAAFAREAAMWVDTQRDLLADFGRIMADWLGRQREVLDVSSRSMQRVWECRNVNELLQAQQQWAADYLRWTASQLRAAGQDANLMTRKATARFAETARDQAEDLRRESSRRRGGVEPEKTEPAAAD